MNSHSVSKHAIRLDSEVGLGTRSDRPVIPEMMREKFENIEAHYDLSDEFFELFLDPTRIYSCAYFRADGMSLEDAQIAKIDMHLDKLNLEPGMTLLEIGCGWGTSLRRAIEKYDVNVIGLTISRNHYASSLHMLDQLNTDRSYRVLLRGWEEFDEPVDRIFSVEAIEHFGFERYNDFFETCFKILPENGRMTLQSTVSFHPDDFRKRGKPLTFEVCRFIKFILTEVFPGARLPSPEMMRAHGERVGFTVSDVTALGSHYAKTLSLWADALEANKSAAIKVQSEEMYNRYMKYLRGCQEKFTDEYIDLHVVTYEKPGTASDAAKRTGRS